MFHSTNDYYFEYEPVGIKGLAANIKLKYDNVNAKQAYFIARGIIFYIGCYGVCNIDPDNWGKTLGDYKYRNKDKFKCNKLSSNDRKILTDKKNILREKLNKDLNPELLLIKIRFHKTGKSTFRTTEFINVFRHSDRFRYILFTYPNDNEHYHGRVMIEHKKEALISRLLELKDDPFVKSLSNPPCELTSINNEEIAKYVYNEIVVFGHLRKAGQLNHNIT